MPSPVLVVDDHPDLGRILVLLLRADGFDAAAALDGAEARTWPGPGGRPW